MQGSADPASPRNFDDLGGQLKVKPKDGRELFCPVQICSPQQGTSYFGKPKRSTVDGQDNLDSGMFPGQAGKGKHQYNRQQLTPWVPSCA